MPKRSLCIYLYIYKGAKGPEDNFGAKSQNLERKNENIWRVFAAGIENGSERIVFGGQKQPKFSDFHNA
jgi:hypothetical protein